MLRPLYIILIFIVCAENGFAQTNNLVNLLAFEADSLNLLARKYMMTGKRDNVIIPKALSRYPVLSASQQLKKLIPA